MEVESVRRMELGLIMSDKFADSIAGESRLEVLIIFATTR